MQEKNCSYQLAVNKNRLEMDIASNVAVGTQLAGVDGLGIVRGVKQGYDASVALQSTIEVVSNVIRSARVVRDTLSESDNRDVKMHVEELVRELNEVQSKLPEARSTSVLRAEQKRKELETSTDAIRNLISNVDAAVNRVTLSVGLESQRDIKDISNSQSAISKSLSQIKESQEESKRDLNQVLNCLRAMQETLQQLVAVLSAPAIAPVQTTESLLTKLKELAYRRKEEHQLPIVQRVETLAVNDSKWKRASESSSATDNTPGDVRSSVAGDYELRNKDKVQVTMESHESEPLYFHILITDSKYPAPKIFFLQTAATKNELRCSVERKFPNRLAYKDDPKFWAFFEDVHKRKMQEFFAYFVFTKERLGTGDALLTTAHMVERLSSGEDVLVEVVKFVMI